MKRDYSDAATRLARYTSLNTETGCVEWQRKPSPEGYGQLSVGGVHYGAHRLAYELARGPIAPGLHLDHLCRVRHCVNPEHLEPVTPGENLRRSDAVITTINAAKTHCPQGHPYDKANTYRRGNRRTCRTCAADKQRRYLARRAAMTLEVSA